MPDTLLGPSDSLMNKIKDHYSYGVIILAGQATKPTRFVPENLQELGYQISLEVAVNMGLKHEDRSKVFLWSN